MGEYVAGSAHEGIIIEDRDGREPAAPELVMPVVYPGNFSGDIAVDVVHEAGQFTEITGRQEHMAVVENEDKEGPVRLTFLKLRRHLNGSKNKTHFDSFPPKEGAR